MRQTYIPYVWGDTRLWHCGAATATADLLSHCIYSITNNKTVNITLSHPIIFIHLRLILPSPLEPSTLSIKKY